MKRILCLIIAACPILGQAQKSPVKFGEITVNDLHMKTYEPDSSADAVILMDYGKAYIDIIIDKPVLIYERHVRIKILNQKGLSRADVSIPIYHSGSSEERITNFKAVTYNLEGGKIVETKVSKDNIFKEKFNRYLNKQKFTFPAAKAGSVLEYSYAINSDFFTVFPNWQFQYSIPTLYSEFWAIFPNTFNYQKFVQGYVLDIAYEQKGGMVGTLRTQNHHWIAKQVPAFKEEPYLTTEDDYISRINFALSTIDTDTGSRDIMGSWQSLNEQLMEDEDFGKVIAKSGFLKDKVEELTAGITDPMAKVSAIHTFLRDYMQWNEDEDFYAGNLKKIFDEKKGSSGDINLMLASMLDKAGFAVDMILLSTRDHGFIRRAYPMTRQFNYVICAVKVGDKQLLLDATDKYLPMEVLPERCLNGEGLIISQTFKGWIDIPAKAKAKTFINAELKVDPSGELNGKLSYTRDGYDAREMRKKYFEKGEQLYLKDYTATSSWQVNKSQFSNLKDFSKSSREEHEILITEGASTAGDVVYINPFVAMRHEENPFKLEKRVYPVNYGRQEELFYLLKFTIPDGFVVDEVPPNKAFALSGNAAKFVYNVTQLGNQVAVVCNIQINKTLFVQDEYPSLREFYNQAIAKQSEQIVLKKK